MKNRTAFFLLAFISAFLCLASVSNALFTGKSFQSYIDVSLQIIGGLPSAEIIKPINGTYLSNFSLPLNVILDADNAWYNIDNGQNISISGNTTFNTSEGSHFIHLFANRSGAIVEKERQFHVNLTRLAISYGKYRGSYKGDSTQFYDYAYEELGNLSNVTLEDTRYGKIVFISIINATDSNGSLLDIENNINISAYEVSANTKNILNFNKSATILFYNSAFTNPVIKHNGASCDVCWGASSFNATLAFNVLSLEGTFSVGEAAVPPIGGIVPPAPPVIPPAPLPAPIPPLCIENWKCSEWKECINGFQARSCQDMNNCGTVSNKPSESQTCIIPKIKECIPEWKCDEWGACALYSNTEGVLTANVITSVQEKQSRTCRDINACEGPRTETKDCKREVAPVTVERIVAEGRTSINLKSSEVKEGQIVERKVAQIVIVNRTISFYV